MDSFSEIDRSKKIEFTISMEKAQPLLLLEYLNNWGNEFLFIFLIITSAFLLLFLNFVPLPETVPTILGIQVSSYWSTRFPVFVLIIAAVALAIYYNLKRRYIEKMLYMFAQQQAELDAIRKELEEEKTLLESTVKKPLKKTAGKKRKTKKKKAKRTKKKKKA